MKGLPVTVVITGASAGLGRAIAHRFARDGAQLGLIARDRERLEATRREVESLGAAAVVCSADVADAGALDRAADRIEHELGPIGIWVNNAMVSVFAPVTAMQPDEYRRVTEVTYLGCVFGTLTALRYMRPRNQGVIIQVGSALAYRSIPLQSAYCAAKHAVAGFTASLRCELIHERSKIRVTMVQMPAMNTPQFEWVRSRLPRRAQPVPPIFQPEVCAEAVRYSAYHDVGREMLVGWPTVQAVWGNKFVPALLDRYLGRSGFRSQQAEEFARAGRPDNLWLPVLGGWGAHGRFDDRARRRSIHVWLRLRPAAVGTVLAVLTVAAAWLLLR